MNQVISPSKVFGKIIAPSSKSSMQRACAAALITSGTTIIDNIGTSNDERAAIDIISRLGAEIQIVGNKLTVTSHDYIFHSQFPEKNVVLNVGESGLSMRMFAPVAALFNYDISFNGHGSILKRPMNFFDEIFPELGVEVHSNHGKLPISIKGPVQPKNISVDGSLSSQFLTGLLFSFAKACTVPVSITVKNLTSKPYIDLSIDVLRQFGFHVENHHYETFVLNPAEPMPSHSIKYKVEGDWSNAAFILVAAAIAGEVSISGLELNSSQGDKNIMQALYDCGATVILQDEEIVVKKNQLKGFEFDATHCPDLFPPLVALACYCTGTTMIKGVNRLLHKESNRAIALRDEFRKLGGSIELEGDWMTVKGDTEIKGAAVFSHNDHRIAMATAVAGLAAKGKTTIENAEAVNKSYPGFFKDLHKLTV